MTDWMNILRRRALWVVVGAGLTVLGVLSLTAVPAWPVVGVAVAAAAIVLNSLTARLQATTCLGCGGDLAGQPNSPHGRMCPTCGTINEKPVPGFEVAASGGGDRASDAPADPPPGGPAGLA
jgi:hypothetical protein